jgi:hypothetical protein
MTVRWALTYKVDPVDVLKKEYVEKGINRANNEIFGRTDPKFAMMFFKTMRYCFKAPTRAFKAVGSFSGQDRMTHALEVASGTEDLQHGVYRRTGVLLLKSAAFAIVGETNELQAWLRTFPQAVVRISVAPGERLQAGYARVGKKPKLGAVKDKETLMIFAPQKSWWDERDGNEPIVPIHTKKSWHEFVEPVMGDKTKEMPVVLNEFVETTTLASWLSRCDKDDPWVFPAKDKHEDKDDRS